MPAEVTDLSKAGGLMDHSRPTLRSDIGVHQYTKGTSLGVTGAKLCVVWGWGWGEVVWGVHACVMCVCMCMGVCART